MRQWRIEFPLAEVDAEKAAVTFLTRAMNLEASEETKHRAYRVLEENYNIILHPINIGKTGGFHKEADSFLNMLWKWIKYEREEKIIALLSRKAKEVGVDHSGLILRPTIAR